LRNERAVFTAALFVQSYVRVIATQPEPPMAMDIVYLGLTAALFALTFGLIQLCERV
jgi:hypothetical protein